MSKIEGTPLVESTTSMACAGPSLQFAVDDRYQVVMRLRRSTRGRYYQPWGHNSVPAQDLK